MTGKAFRHELKRLFASIAVRLRLTQEPLPKSNDRRTTTCNINYLTGDTPSDARMKHRGSSPGTVQLLRSRQSFDSTISNGASVPSYFRQQQSATPVHRKNLNDITYYFQRISNV